jgi:acyl-CoA dehydrogenase
VNAVAAFLDPAHLDLAARASAWSRSHLRERPEPASDEQARADASGVVRAVGDGGWLNAIGAQDIRALCVVRETVAGHSSLADALIAIQGLGATPLLLAGTAAQRERWVNALVTGRAIAAFAGS